MKIFGIGIDIVNINRIAKSIKQKKFINKLFNKGCDWIIANHISDKPSSLVFGSDQNKASLLKGVDIIHWPYQSKQALAERLIVEIDHWIKAHDHSTETK